jgi:hypothetical protein
MILICYLSLFLIIFLILKIILTFLFYLKILKFSIMRARCASIVRTRIAFEAWTITKVTDELVQVSVGRIWAFFKTRAIQRIKWSGLVTRRTLVRVRSNAFLARRVAEVTNSRIVEISLREVAPVQFSQEGWQRLQTPELLKYP